MRDSRFLEEYATAADAERRAAGAQLLSSTSEAARAEVDRLLEGWWSEVLSQDLLSDEERAERVQGLRTSCSSVSLEAQKLALTVPSAIAGNSDAVNRSAGARLLGESAAAVVRRAKTAVELDRAVRFLSRCWKAVEALEEAILRPPAWPGTTEPLSVANASIADLLGHHYDRVPSTEVLTEEERGARERGVSAYFWGHYDELPLNDTSVVRLVLVARRDWGEIATMADALPLRAFRDWLWLSLHLEDDRDSILALLRAAPPVFANDEWTGSTSALAGLRAAVLHAEKLHGCLARATRVYQPAPDAEAKLTALEEEELPSWLRTVAEVALARTDGRPLLLLYASTLVRHDLTPPWNGQRSWPASRHALRAIYKVLVPKSSLVECQQVARMGGVPSNRTTIDHATYLICSALLDAAPSEVWWWYRELLLGNDDDLCWQARSCQRRALCYCTLAERLGQLSDPFGEWRSVWAALFVTDRERARFATTDQSALYPSWHLLRVGAELLRQKPSRSSAWAFFEELTAHTRTLLANDARWHSPMKAEIALDAMDIGPRIPGAAWSGLVATHHQLLVNARNRVYLAALLLEGGASFADAEAAVETAPHRLKDSVAELRSAEFDLSALQLCDLVDTAEKQHAASLALAP